MKAHRILLYAALLLAACACEFNFPLDDVSEPAIFIEFLPSSPYSTSTFKVGYADGAYGKPSSINPPKVEDISVSVNGKAVKLQKECIRNGNMITVLLEDAFLNSGDKVDIEVKSGQAPRAHASTIVPPVPGLESVDMAKAESDTTGNTLRVTVKLAEEVGEGDYYGLRILEKNTIVTASGIGGLYTGEQQPAAFTPMVFQVDTSLYYNYKLPGQVASREDLNSLDLDAFANAAYNGSLTEEGYNVEGPMMLLTYKQFQDRSYSFYVSRSSGFDWSILLPDDFEVPERDYPETDLPVDIPDTGETTPEEPVMPVVLMDNVDYVVEVYRLSEELYNYFKAQYLMQFNLLSNFGVTPPNFTYSNVRGGLGIVGGISGTRSEWFPNPDNTEGVSPEELISQIIIPGMPK